MAEDRRRNPLVVTLTDKLAASEPLLCRAKRAGMRATQRQQETHPGPSSPPISPAN
ncbi:hypothetical protein MPLSOD_290121 [Mesorhizobium sp. SOD10]|nr:hypothetical protein MPLSOD_290121 [Mesorhizobium sp. SOD10]